MNDIQRHTIHDALPSCSRMSRRHAGGFVLVVTLSLMILLVIIAVGLLSLSSISLRQSRLQGDMARAQSNARLALVLALGELQKSAGPDQRVTAPADCLEENHGGGKPAPRVAGVWRSWENMDLEGGSATGLPIAPDYGQKTATGSYDIDPKASPGRFLRWLVSEDSGAGATSPPELEFIDQVTVPLLAGGTLGTGVSEGQVHVKPTLLMENGQPQATGAYSWWVSPDNQKAHLAPADREKKEVLAWRDSMASHGVANPETDVDPDSGLLKLNAEQRTKMTSRQSLDLATLTAGVSGAEFHDFTTRANGLLTNTSGGGWRKDLSLLSERYEDYKASADKDSDSLCLRQDECLYPWFQALPPNPGASDRIKFIPPVKHWQGLVDFMTQYKPGPFDPGEEFPRTFKSSGDAILPMKFSDVQDPLWIDPNKDQGHYRYTIHDLSANAAVKTPVVSRVQFILAHSAVKNGSRYNAAIGLTPVVTLWNPWNFTIQYTNLKILCPNLPMNFTWKVGGASYGPYPFYKLRNPRSPKSGQDSEPFSVIAQIVGDPDYPDADVPMFLGPGETRIYSPPTLDYVNAPSSDNTIEGFVMAEGYRPGGGVRYQLYWEGSGDPSKMNPSKKWKKNIFGYAADSFSFEVDMNAPNLSGYGSDKNKTTLTGMELSARMTATTSLGYEFTHHGAKYDPAEADKLFREFTRELEGGHESFPLNSVERDAQPFAACTITGKTVNDAQFPTRGGFQNDINSPHSLMGLLAAPKPGSGDFYSGQHPANSAIEVFYLKLDDWNDSYAPTGDPTTNRGFVLTGLQQDNCITRCVMNELPLRPMCSLAEFQHFQVRGYNPFPPFRTNIIGNSSAHPLVAADRADIPVPSGSAGSLAKQFDDSYCMNRVLFDDWFLSSIAEDGNGWLGADTHALDEVYKKHVEGTRALPNQQYLPSTAAKLRDPSLDINQDDSWKTIASRLVVDGMFNVNSTSIKAWRALLSHARDHDVAHLTGEYGSGAATTSLEIGHPVSRTTIAGSVCADSGPLESEWDKFAGYRRLTDEQIDALATEIVAQIRKRGPALSLSEFVNRQLTSNTELALAGPVQAALDKLARMGSQAVNPYADLQELGMCVPVSSNPDAGDRFPEAAEGWSGEGMPGWITQADILRPLAPVLSARDDTFTIRAYGDARDQRGKVIARAWCEAVVQRSPDYLAADPSLADPTSDDNVKTGSNQETNQRFGRRFVIASFSWLTAQEI